ncbi:ATP-binding cassette domain-containing protein [Geomicrobium sp. JSM 1781026]|uniref:ATP-binding cassette domain-containing protein n=1 Tax=Geomicrobium sp. JSM 1781026 TaxID=3344580 RepID=UPI0035C1CBB4
MSNIAIEAKGLAKKFGEQRAVDGIDLTIPKGMVYGFLGPNGAGKTTTIRMLATLLKPDGGSAKVFGHDISSETSAVRSRISLTGQYASLDEDLTGKENLVMISRLMGYSKKEAINRADELLVAFRLDGAAKKQVKNYSGGMRRRMDIAASIVVTPDLLFLDEPTTGLDPESRIEVWGIVRSLVRAGTTVLLTTQYLEEADQLADRIAVINQGKLIAEGTSAELKASIGRNTLHVQFVDENDLSRAKQIIESKLNNVVQIIDAHSLSIQVNQPSKIAETFSDLANEHIQMSSFSLGQPSLDEVFLTLTGSKTPDEEKINDETNE